MFSIENIALIVIKCGIVFTCHAQITEKRDTMDAYEMYGKKLDDFLKLTSHLDQKRLDIDGFIFYSDYWKDSIPQEVFLLPYSSKSYEDVKTLEDNFLNVVTQPNVVALEEVFMSMRWTMPTLLEELKKCTYFMTDSNYPILLNGLPLRVIYGRIVFKTYSPLDTERTVYRPSVSSIAVKLEGKEHIIPIRRGEYGTPYFFKALR